MAHNKLDVLDIWKMLITKDPKNKVMSTDDYTVWMKEGDRYIEGKDGKFHMLFRKGDGFTIKWGTTYDEDPAFNPYGPEIADIELTKRCAGIRNSNGVNEVCKFCYKNNSVTNNDYMTFEQFKHIFKLWDKPKTLTQIAFGTDASLSEKSNPDYWKIFDYCNKHGVTPNVTVADVDENTADKMAKTFGACAVSYYPTIDKNRCYDSVAAILKAARNNGRTMAVNIHALVSDETYDSLFELLNDYEKDERLKGLNAIVFLSLKQKGRGVHFNRVTDEQFKRLVDECFGRNIRFGMDSCTAPKFLKAIEGREDYEQLSSYVESCESLLFSSYIDCTGKFYPCSFMEKEGDWAEGIDVLKCTDLLKDIWYAPASVKWREDATRRMSCNCGCNTCPYYNV